MCGIIGYTGEKQAASVLLPGLRKLAYRGYDSTGMVVADGAKFHAVRSAEYRTSIDKVSEQAERASLRGTSGMGHTRWATHGAVTEQNAHPIMDAAGRLAIVHNGIVENHAELRRELTDSGYSFTTETDTECVLLLMVREMESGGEFAEAFRAAAARLVGHSTIIAMSADEPGTILGCKIGAAGGLMVACDADSAALGSDEVVLAADYDAAYHLEQGDVVTVRAGSVSFTDISGTQLTREPQPTSSGDYEMTKAGYPHFLAKEIAEQPAVVKRGIAQRLDFDEQRSTLLSATEEARLLDGVTRVIFIGMGSSYNVALLAALQLEALARVTAWTEIASEFNLRDVALDENTLVVAITQSGETSDTLLAMTRAAEAGARVLAVVENVHSQASRIASHTVSIMAGAEYSVAATKTVMATMSTLLQFTLQMARYRGQLAPADAKALFGALATFDADVSAALELNPQMETVAERLKSAAQIIMLGGHYSYPIAREGALKIKELAYLSVEAIQNGEMKHGTHALLSPETYIIAVVPAAGTVRKKLLNGLSEAKARSAKIITIAEPDDAEAAKLADERLFIPPAHATLAPLLAVIPMQQLAYKLALILGNHPDQPRNLAKTVTVE